MSNAEGIPKEIDLTEEQLEEFMGRLDRDHLTEADRTLIRQVFSAYIWVHKKLQEQEMTLKGMLRGLFGKKTESSRNILKAARQEEGSREDATTGAPPEPTGAHGRRSNSEYSGARRIRCAHPELTAESQCPDCRRGTLFTMKTPSVFIHFKARPTIDADVYECERLRCSACGKIYKAPSPAPSQRWDPTAKSIAALMRYGAGVPHFRTETLQGLFAIPISDATLFDRSNEVADAGFPAYLRLVKIAAQGTLLHADDTSMRILELMKENEANAVKGERTGIYTTAIISIAERREICLFFTGRNHAGENLDQFLKHRLQETPAPMLMCDGADRNVPKSLQTVLLNCTTHARRKFVDVYESFTAEVTHVIRELAVVYRNDEATRDLALTPEERLAYHREQSAPVMERLRLWCLALLSERKVEPNSGLGKAINYLEKRWDRLTQFLRIPGAPISNDIAERLLKRAVLHRKNSLFYLTRHGAAVGDILMSLIQTAARTGANPFDYLTELQRHRAEVRDNPDGWLPWTYQATLTALIPKPPPA